MRAEKKPHEQKEENKKKKKKKKTSKTALWHDYGDTLARKNLFHDTVIVVLYLCKATDHKIFLSAYTPNSRFIPLPSHRLDEDINLL